MRTISCTISAEAPTHFQIETPRGFRWLGSGSVS